MIYENDAIIQGNFKIDELEKAKTQLSGEYLRSYEDRATVMELFAREAQAFDAPLETHYVLEQIRSVTKSDIINIVEKILKSKPSIAILGLL